MGEHLLGTMHTDASRYGAFFKYCKQYHFKPFIILGILQAINIDKISASIPQVARRCPQMEEYAQTVANKFGRALLLFSKCHNQFNSKKGLSEDDLDTLG